MQNMYRRGEKGERDGRKGALSASSIPAVFFILFEAIYWSQSFQSL